MRVPARGTVVYNILIRMPASLPDYAKTLTLSAQRGEGVDVHDVTITGGGGGIPVPTDSGGAGGAASCLPPA
ncbi:MAG: hypothetical protein ACJ73S_26025 [Mycobacteriales bacterium]